MSVCINLIPPDIVVVRHANVRRRRWFAAGIVVACAGLIVSIAVRASLRDPHGLAEELARANARRDAAAADVTNAKNLLKQAQTRLEAVGGLADRPNWSILLSVIANSRLPSTVIDSVAVKKVIPPPQAAPAAGTPAPAPTAGEGSFNISIAGRAENQRDILTLAMQLQDTGIFDTVRQERVQGVRVGERELLEFEFSCHMGPKVDKPGAAK